MDLQFNFAGVSDNDASLQGSTGVFGLNENAHLTKLEELNIEGTGVSDLAPLSKLKKLKKL